MISNKTFRRFVTEYRLLGPVRYIEKYKDTHPVTRCSPVYFVNSNQLAMTPGTPFFQFTNLGNHLEIWIELDSLDTPEYYAYKMPHWCGVIDTYHGISIPRSLYVRNKPLREQISYWRTMLLRKTRDTQN